MLFHLNILLEVFIGLDPDRAGFSSGYIQLDGTADLHLVKGTYRMLLGRDMAIPMNPAPPQKVAGTGKNGQEEEKGWNRYFFHVSQFNTQILHFRGSTP